MKERCSDKEQHRLISALAKNLRPVDLAKKCAGNDDGKNFESDTTQAKKETTKKEEKT